MLEQVREARAPVTAANVSAATTVDELRKMFGVSGQLIMSRLYDQAMEVLYALYQHPNVPDTWKSKIALNIAACLRDTGQNGRLPPDQTPVRFYRLIAN